MGREKFGKPVIAKLVSNKDGTYRLLASFDGLLLLDPDLHDGGIVTNGKRIGKVGYRIVPGFEMLEKRPLVYCGPTGTQGKIVKIIPNYQGQKPHLVQSDKVVMTINIVKQN